MSTGKFAKKSAVELAGSEGKVCCHFVLIFFAAFFCILYFHGLMIRSRGKGVES